MRRLTVLALATGLASALPAAAQEPPPPAPQARPHRGNGAFKELGLTEDQKQKLREIRQQYPDDPKARRKAIEAILTPEQRDKLKEMRRHRRELRRPPQD